jgi:LPS-assembly lipoprotein
MLYYRSFTLVLCALLVSGCGFRPLFGGGRDSDAAAELATIHIEPISDRIGQQLHNDLLDLLNPSGRAAEPRYVLYTVLEGSTQGRAIAKTEFSTRSNYGLTVTFQLVEAGGGKLIVKGSKTVVSSYNILTSNFGTLMAEKDAKARAVQQISQYMYTKLSVFFVQRQAERDKRVR